MNDRMLKADFPAPGAEIDFDAVVDQYHEMLFRFAFSLSGNAHDAADMTQETFRVLLVKSAQIRDTEKIKSWLVTTLYRQFLGQRRHSVRFPKLHVEKVESELPVVSADQVEQADSGTVLAALQSLDDKYRLPISMFYFDEFTYKEIADSLGVPVGTVMSRISRGKELLRARLAPAWNYVCADRCDTGRNSIKHTEKKRNTLGQARPVLNWQSSLTATETRLNCTCGE